MYIFAKSTHVSPKLLRYIYFHSKNPNLVLEFTPHFLANDFLTSYVEDVNFSRLQSWEADSSGKTDQ